MTVKAWIRRYLGIDEIYDQINDLQRYVTGVRRELSGIRNQGHVANMAMGRLIAKLDPMYGLAEDDPKRKAASDALGEEIIRKLTGEDHYSNRTRDL